MPTLEEIYPPYGLTLTCADLELRVLRDDDLPELIELIHQGVTDPQLPMPFLADWHERPYGLGRPDMFPATSLPWWWSQRATFAPSRWQLPLAVRHAGVLVGMQDLMTEHFPQTRTVTTGSWLGRRHHGRGLGTLMRQVAVGFAFDELDAVVCRSAYLDGNHASAAVSRKVGYEIVDRVRAVQRVDGRPVGVQEARVQVTPGTYVRPLEPVRVDGAAALRRFLGVERHPGSNPDA